MPKKLKKVSKSKKVASKSSVVHHSFRQTPHHADSLVKKYAVYAIALVAIIIGALLYRNMLVSPEINMISSEDRVSSVTSKTSTTTKKQTRGQCIAEMKIECADRNRKFVSDTRCGHCGAVLPTPTPKANGGGHNNAPLPIGIMRDCTGMTGNKCCETYGGGHNSYTSKNDSNGKYTGAVYATFGEKVLGMSKYTMIYCYDTLSQFKSSIPDDCKSFGDVYKTEGTNPQTFKNTGTPFCAKDGACYSANKNATLYQPSTGGTYLPAAVTAKGCKFGDYNATDNNYVTVNGHCCPQ